MGHDLDMAKAESVWEFIQEDLIERDWGWKIRQSGLAFVVSVAVGSAYFSDKPEPIDWVVFNWVF
jgi:hypothetical protein